MSEIKLQDYIHYYIGCRVFIPDCNEYGKLMGGTFVPNSVNQIYYMIRTDEMVANEDEDFDMPYNDDADEPARIKPILRKIEDRTAEETKTYNTIVGKRTDGVHSVIIHHDTPETFHWLIKQGFDLFELIKNGLAIDSKTLK